MLSIVQVICDFDRLQSYFDVQHFVLLACFGFYILFIFHAIQQYQTNNNRHGTATNLGWVNWIGSFWFASISFLFFPCLSIYLQHSWCVRLFRIHTIKATNSFNFIQISWRIFNVHHFNGSFCFWHRCKEEEEEANKILNTFFSLT